MESLVSNLNAWVSDIEVVLVVRAILIGVVGLGLSKLIAMGFARTAGKSAGKQHQAVLQRIAYYVCVVVTIAFVLRHLGFDLTVLLGAAGVLTVAIGFASQTSASNIISGLFLLGERPFVVGDIIRVETTTGTVVSIDLLAVKLRTFDNLSVRVPNETLLKSTFTNLTHYPIRRYDLQLKLGFDEDLDRVQDVLIAVAEANPICLDEPQPLLIFQGFGDSWLNVQFSVWSATENFLELRNSISADAKRALQDNGFEIPIPRRSIRDESRELVSDSDLPLQD